MSTFDFSGQTNGTTLDAIDALWAGPGESTYNVQSGKLQPAAWSANVAVYQGGQPSAQRSEIVLPASAVINDGLRLYVNNTDLTAATGYYAVITTTGVEWRRLGAWSGTTSVTVDTSAQQTLALIHDGAGNLRVERNGTLIASYTDGTPQTGGAPGFQLDGGGTPGGLALMSWTDGIALGPTITAQPQSLAVTAGATPTWSVSATGSGTLHYAWTYKGAAVSGNDAATYSPGAVALADDGAAVTVTVSDTNGSTLSATATLAVGSPAVRAWHAAGAVPAGTLGWLGRPSASGTTQTLITSLSAAVQLARSASTDASAAVQTSRTASASLDVAAQAAKAAQASISAALQRALSAALGLDVAAQLARTVGASTDAAVQIARNAAAALDVAAQAARSVGVAVDVQVQAATTASTSLSAQVQAGNTASAGADAAVLNARSLGALVDLAVQLPRAAGANIDAGVQRATSAAVAAGAAVQSAQSLGVGLDAQVQGGQTVAAVVQAAVQAARTATVGLHLAVVQAANASTSIGAAVALGRTLSVALDAATRATAQCGAGLSAWIVDSTDFVSAPAGSGPSASALQRRRESQASPNRAGARSHMRAPMRKTTR